MLTFVFRGDDLEAADAISAAIGQVPGSVVGDWTSVVLAEDGVWARDALRDLKLRERLEAIDNAAAATAPTNWWGYGEYDFTLPILPSAKELRLVKQIKPTSTLEQSTKERIFPSALWMPDASHMHADLILSYLELSANTPYVADVRLKWDTVQSSSCHSVLHAVGKGTLYRCVVTDVERMEWSPVCTISETPLFQRENWNTSVWLEASHSDFRASGNVFFTTDGWKTHTKLNHSVDFTNWNDEFRDRNIVTYIEGGLYMLKSGPGRTGGGYIVQMNNDLTDVTSSFAPNLVAGDAIYGVVPYRADVVDGTSSLDLNALGDNSIVNCDRLVWAVHNSGSGQLTIYVTQTSDGAVLGSQSWAGTFHAASFLLEWASRTVLAVGSSLSLDFNPTTGLFAEAPVALKNGRGLFKSNLQFDLVQAAGSTRLRYRTSPFANNTWTEVARDLPMGVRSETLTYAPVFPWQNGAGIICSSVSGQRVVLATLNGAGNAATGADMLHFPEEVEQGQARSAASNWHFTKVNDVEHLYPRANSSPNMAFTDSTQFPASPIALVDPLSTQHFSAVLYYTSAVLKGSKLACTMYFPPVEEQRDATRAFLRLQLVWDSTSGVPEAAWDSARAALNDAVAGKWDIINVRPSPSIPTVYALKGLTATRTSWPEAPLSVDPYADITAAWVPLSIEWLSATTAGFTYTGGMQTLHSMLLISGSAGGIPLSMRSDLGSGVQQTIQLAGSVTLPSTAAGAASVMFTTFAARRRDLDVPTMEAVVAPGTTAAMSLRSQQDMLVAEQEVQGRTAAFLSPSGTRVTSVTTHNIVGGGAYQQVIRGGDSTQVQAAAYGLATPTPAADDGTLSFAWFTVQKDLNLAPFVEMYYKTGPLLVAATLGFNVIPEEENSNVPWVDPSSVPEPPSQTGDITAAGALRDWGLTHWKPMIESHMIYLFYGFAQTVPALIQAWTASVGIASIETVEDAAAAFAVMEAQADEPTYVSQFKLTSTKVQDGAVVKTRGFAPPAAWTQLRTLAGEMQMRLVVLSGTWPGPMDGASSTIRVALQGDYLGGSPTTDQVAGREWLRAEYPHLVSFSGDTELPDTLRGAVVWKGSLTATLSGSIITVSGTVATAAPTPAAYSVPSTFDCTLVIDTTSPVTNWLVTVQRPSSNKSSDEQADTGLRSWIFEGSMRFISANPVTTTGWSYPSFAPPHANVIT